jgi:hypothetical protein
MSNDLGEGAETANSVKLENKGDGTSFILVRVDGDGGGPSFNLDESINEVIESYVEDMTGEVKQEMEKHFSEITRVKSEARARDYKSIDIDEVGGPKAIEITIDVGETANELKMNEIEVAKTLMNKTATMRKNVKSAIRDGNDRLVIPDGDTPRTDVKVSNCTSIFFPCV